MVRLNGKPFPEFDSKDSDEKKIRKIARVLRTLPKFIFVREEDLRSESPGNIIPQELQDEIKKNHDKTDIDSFYQDILFPRVSKEELLVLWFKDLHDVSQEELDATAFAFVEKSWEELERKYITYPENEISIFLNQQEIEEKAEESIKDILPVQITTPLVRKNTFDITFKVTFDLIEIFDRFKLSNYVPYVNNGPFRHKIFRGFKNKGEDWETTPDDTVIKLYTLTTKEVPSKFNEDNYTFGVITLSSEKKDEAILSVEIESKDGNMDLVISRIFEAMDIDQKTANVQKNISKITCVSKIPNQVFNKFVLSDIITNHLAICQVAYIEETSKVGKTRQIVNFKYHLGPDEDVSISLTEKHADSNDFKSDPALFAVGSYYVLVRISNSPSIEIVHQINEFVGILFRIYQDTKETVVRDYAKFIPGFELSEERQEFHPSKTPGQDLSMMEPSIFMKGNPRAANTKGLRKVDEFVYEITKDRKKVMIPPTDEEGKKRNYTFIFPKGHPEKEKYSYALLYPRSSADGKQHWYSCSSEMKSKYVGVKVNKNNNLSEEMRKKFPYILSCFLRNQIENPNKKFDAYYHGVEREEVKPVSNYIKTTLKFIRKGENGELPLEIKSLLNNYTTDVFQFSRLGGNRSPESFIEAVATAMGVEKPPRSKFQDFNICRQSAWVYTSEQLRDKFNGKDYIDPNIYTRLLEEYFGCYIYRFIRDDKNKITVAVPPHNHTLLRYKHDPKRPIVLILEHYGAETDVAEYPQCELIVCSIDKIRFTRFERPKFTTLIQNLDKVFRETVISYSGFSQVQDIDPSSLPSFDKIFAQAIDQLGKTRVLFFKHQGQTLVCHSPPLPPLKVSERAENKERNSKEAVQRYLNDQKIPFHLENDKIIVFFSGSRYEFPLQISKQSTLNRFNENKRIARYLQEYSYYLFSIFIRDRKEEKPSVALINEFLREKMVVVKDFAYPKIPRKFSLQSKYLQKEKLIVPSEETKQRLGYSIEVMILRNPRMIHEYCQLEWIQQYYMDQIDFTQHESSLFFNNDQALIEWIGEKQSDHRLYTLPQKEAGTYFLLVNQEIFLIEPSDSFEQALFISRFWNENKFNPVDLPEKGEDESDDFMYYKFFSPSKVESVGDSLNKVLVWREDSKLYYGAMLKP
jgi:hypothetical protein